ncbi:hypothetical protein ACJZ2D_014644 [Fusarium nematophilum]
MMRTVSAAAIRRRGRRRVADENRKRAAQACDRCKARKSKCIDSAPGMCQSCLQNNLTCRFERRKAPPSHNETQSPLPDEASVATNHDTPNYDHVPQAGRNKTSIENHQPERILWPKFLSHLRDVFSLDPEEGLEEREALATQAVRHLAWCDQQLRDLQFDGQLDGELDHKRPHLAIYLRLRDKIQVHLNCGASPVLSIPESPVGGQERFLQLLEQNDLEPINNGLSGTELPGDIINSVDELIGDLGHLELE